MTVAERHAVSAELAVGRADVDMAEHDVDEHQDTYDIATVRAVFERLAPGPLACPAADRRGRPPRYGHRAAGTRRRVHRRAARRDRHGPGGRPARAGGLVAVEPR